MTEVLQHKPSQQEQLLQHYILRLEESNASLEQFAFLASHNLQAPLTKLRRFCSMLKITHLDMENRDIINRMHTCVRRLENLVEDTLTFARITTHHMPFEKVDLNALVRLALDDHEEHIKPLGAQIQVSELPILEGNPAQLHQLVCNLINNALKFRREDVSPEIKIYSRYLDRQTCQLIVEDNGIGFSQGHSERIFEMFERLHGVSHYEGSGIGLAICKKVVECHHGNIKAQGTPNQGAKFIISLPLRQSS